MTADVAGEIYRGVQGCCWSCLGHQGRGWAEGSWVHRGSAGTCGGPQHLILEAVACLDQRAGEEEGGGLSEEALACLGREEEVPKVLALSLPRHP